MNPHTFRLRLEWKRGTTPGDRVAMIYAFEREIIQVYGLREIESDGIFDTRVLKKTYGFRERISADAMHDICRAIFRFLRKRKELHGIGISDRTWWTPKFDPYVDIVDPIADTLAEAP